MFVESHVAIEQLFLSLLATCCNLEVFSLLKCWKYQSVLFSGLNLHLNTLLLTELLQSNVFLSGHL